MMNIATAAKIVNREVNKAGLVDILGSNRNINVQGEQVQKLDQYAQDSFLGTHWSIQKSFVFWHPKKKQNPFLSRML